ncbi:MAG: hypothetical protein AAFY88_11140 [Acidobacteriota bacterium]
MNRKSITLCLSALALLLCASVFAAGPAPTPGLSSSISVGINGCIASGTGDFICQASAFGGSGSFNYWWQHSGNGQLYQTNSPSVSVTGCTSGSFTLTVQVRDRSTGNIAKSRPLTVTCGGGGGIGFGR